jgi:hypothetical protein
MICRIEFTILSLIFFIYQDDLLSGRRKVSVWNFFQISERLRINYLTGFWAPFSGLTTSFCKQEVGKFSWCLELRYALDPVLLYLILLSVVKYWILCNIFSWTFCHLFETYEIGTQRKSSGQCHSQNLSLTPAYCKLSFWPDITFKFYLSLLFRMKIYFTKILKNMRNGSVQARFTCTCKSDK